MTESTLLASLDDGVLTLTLNRPEQRNAVDPALREALLVALDDAVESGAGAIVLRGNGPTFCAGADLGASKPDPGVGSLRRMRVSTQRLISELLGHPLPVVAAVRGTCAGFGVSLALAADFCVVSEDAAFVPAFSAVGLAPDGAVALTLTRAVGVVAARRFLMLGEPISGPAAFEAGMVHAVVPPEDVDAVAITLAQQLASRAGAAVSAAKGLISRASEGELASVLAEERSVQGLLTTTADHREGVAALQGRRAPQFGDTSSS